MIRAVMRHFSAGLSLLLASVLLLVPGRTRAEGNFTLSPSEAERRLGHEPFEILEAKRTASGVAGAQKWKLRFRDGLELKVKWKAAPRYTVDSWNNSPRREIAAYELQKWFLDPADYVVPTSEVRCIPLAVYRDKIDAEARPTLLHTSCVLGVLSSWLVDVEEPPEIWRPDLFEQSGYYRFSIAAVDVLTLLIGHQDGRPANFLWSTDPGHHVYSIDNGISLHAFPSNPLVKNWNNIRVPALPKQVVERLAQVSPEQLAATGVLRQLEPDADGMLQLRPPGENLDPDDGTRIRRGTVQLGLRESEIEELRQRIDLVVRRTKSGELGLF